MNFDPKHWSLQDAAEGNRTGPAPGKAVELTLLVIPNEFGVLPLPTLTLSSRRHNQPEEEEKDGGGVDIREERESSVVDDESRKNFVILSDAQVANHSLGQVVSCSGAL